VDECDITREFLIESNENLIRLDQEIVRLEQNPKDAQLLASVFRTMHTIKGTGGMLSFHAVESLAHLAENLLSQIRNGERDLTPPLVSLILKTVDAIKDELLAIETTGQEGSRTKPCRMNLPAPAKTGRPARRLPRSSRQLPSLLRRRRAIAVLCTRMRQKTRPSEWMSFCLIA
jgi:chemotaxis protein histidine kinase CheA